MRKATIIASALLAVLALSVGAVAYPAVVGLHPFSLGQPSAPTVPSHHTGDDNSTGNHTSDNETGDHEAPPAGNETGNETGDHDGNETAPVPPESNETENESMRSNVTVEHNVTVTEQDNTTWVNGTITVVKDNTTLATVTFQIVVHDNGTGNATINVTQMSGSTTITVHGYAVYSAEHRALAVFGVAKATDNGTVLWERMFWFGLPTDCAGSH